MYTMPYRWVWTGYGWQYVPDVAYGPSYWGYPHYSVMGQPYAITFGVNRPTIVYP